MGLWNVTILWVAFSLLYFLGLREYHYLLDIGCGSLRAGRFFIMYLKIGHYFGIDPEKWLIEEAIRKELGIDLIRIKKPTFSYDENLPALYLKGNLIILWRMPFLLMPARSR